LKRRTLAKPLTSATCVIGRSVSASSCLAVSSRRVCRYCMGETPSCASKMRRRCRSLTPSRAASCSTEGRFAGPGFRLVEQARRLLRQHALASCTDQRSACGASSGRQRRQGRKPALSAWAAWAKKRQFSRLGTRTLQTGRQ
jgi:hypothetical protein